MYKGIGNAVTKSFTSPAKAVMSWDPPEKNVTWSTYAAIFAFLSFKGMDTQRFLLLNIFNFDTKWILMRGFFNKSPLSESTIKKD